MLAKRVPACSRSAPSPILLLQRTHLAHIVVLSEFILEFWFFFSRLFVLAKPNARLSELVPAKKTIVNTEQKKLVYLKIARFADLSERGEKNEIGLRKMKMKMKNE